MFSLLPIMAVLLAVLIAALVMRASPSMRRACRLRWSRQIMAQPSPAPDPQAAPPEQLQRATALEMIGQPRQQHDGTLGVVLIAIDQLAHINQTWGHCHGDAVLRTLTQLCLIQGRPKDIVARLDNEALTILLPGASLAEAAAIAERLRISIAHCMVPLADHVAIKRPISSALRFTASIGVAETSADSVNSLDGLLRVANRRLHLAKSSGGNRVVMQEAASATVEAPACCG